MDRPQRFESLEHRVHLTVSQDSNGWTVVTEPAYGKVIYVSSSAGNDGNSGLSPTSPVASLGRAQQLSSSGPNEILLQSGDTFTETSTNNLGSWSLSGQDAQDPFVLGYYSTVNGVSYGNGSRPTIDGGNAGVGIALNGGVSNLDILGIQFEANLRDPTLAHVDTSFTGEVKGLKNNGSLSNLLIEDTSFNYFDYNLDIEAVSGAVVNNVTIRRSVVENAYAFYGGRSQGMYAYSINGLTLSQDTFDHNGWNGDYLYLGAQDIGYNHDVYMSSTNTGVVVTQCIFSNSSYNGLLARSGGTINYNLFINNPVAVSFGSADGADSTVGGVTGSLIGNVVVGDRASQTIFYNSTTEAYQVGPGLPFGQGFVIANTAPGSAVVVSQNVFTQDSQNAKPAITLTMATGTSNPSQAAGLNNLTVTNNIVNGWRQGIQTDGRFVPGGTGLYALNNLTLSNNDYINATTQEVRHDGAFASSQESWSGDHFYDTVLGQSSWVTLQGSSIPFSTWASNYDIGATIYSVLPYADPTRTAATYDATLGGPGTWQDFISQAKQLSITNFQPIYMAQAAVSYIDAGFNIVSGGPGITGGTGGTGSTGQYEPVTGTAATNQVNTASLGATSYTFTVDYSVDYLYQFGLNVNALGNSNLIVTGPAGFSQYATYVSSATPYVDSNGYQQTLATYRITPPGGAWAKGSDGTYTITLLPNQTLVSGGGYAQDGVIGSFNVDVTPPVAAAVISSLTSGNTFTVAYSDASGIDTSTLNSFEVQVTGPSLYSQYGTLTSSTFSAGSNTITCTYTINPPAGGWASVPGSYTMSLLTGTVADLAGNTVAGGTLATFVVGSNASTGSITGTVFNDANGNGTFDSREVPLGGVTVFVDTLGTGVYNSSDPSAVTNLSTGVYTITGLPAGRYTVMDAIPAGYLATNPLTGYSVVTLGAGATVSNINFGDQQNLNIVNGNGGSTGTGTTGTGSTGTGTTGTGTTGTGSTGTGTTGTGKTGSGHSGSTGGGNNHHTHHRD